MSPHDYIEIVSVSGSALMSLREEGRYAVEGVQVAYAFVCAAHAG